MIFSHCIGRKYKAELSSIVDSDRLDEIRERISDWGPLLYVVIVVALGTTFALKLCPEHLSVEQADGCDAA